MKRNNLILLLLVAAVPFSLFIYTVNKSKDKNLVQIQSITIKKDDIKKEIDRTENFYEFSKQNLKSYPSLEADAKERVLENTIIKNYADSHEISVIQKEINERYMQKTESKGKQKLLEQLFDMYGMNKDDYLQVLERDILREKVQEMINEPLAVWLQKQKDNLKVIVN